MPQLSSVHTLRTAHERPSHPRVHGPTDGLIDSASTHPRQSPTSTPHHHTHKQPQHHRHSNQGHIQPPIHRRPFGCDHPSSPRRKSRLRTLTDHHRRLRLPTPPPLKDTQRHQTTHQPQHTETTHSPTHHTLLPTHNTNPTTPQPHRDMPSTPVRKPKGPTPERCRGRRREPQAISRGYDEDRSTALITSLILTSKHARQRHLLQVGRQRHVRILETVDRGIPDRSLTCCIWVTA